MRLFLLAVILIYSIPHLLLYWRLRPLVRPSRRLPLLLLLLGLMASFFVGYAMRRRGLFLNRLVIELSFFWMAFIFWSFCVGVPMDAWNLLIRLVPESRRPRAIPRPIQLRVLVGFTILLFAWSAGEARRIRLARLDFPDAPVSRPVTIAFFSDLHLSPYGNRAAAERTIALLRAAQPDLILCGGDLLDGRTEEIRGSLEALAALQPPLGKYAVLGNHEYYADMDNSLEALAVAGFTVLRESRVEPLPGLSLGGVDDLHGYAAGDICFFDETKALPPPDYAGLAILLKHKPTVTPHAEERAWLQLSGHTHGGQMFPFHLLVRALFERWVGLHPIGRNGHLYVSRGAGTWGPPLRLFAPPEVTFITLGRK